MVPMIASLVPQELHLFLDQRVAPHAVREPIRGKDGIPAQFVLPVHFQILVRIFAIIVPQGHFLPQAQVTVLNVMQVGILEQERVHVRLVEQVRFRPLMDHQLVQVALQELFLCKTLLLALYVPPVLTLMVGRRAVPFVQQEDILLLMVQKVVQVVLGALLPTPGLLLVINAWQEHFLLAITLLVAPTVFLELTRQIMQVDAPIVPQERFPILQKLSVAILALPDNFQFLIQAIALPVQQEPIHRFVQVDVQIVLQVSFLLLKGLSLVRIAPPEHFPFPAQPLA